MYRFVYDKFKDWYRGDGGCIWFYGDPHFGDIESCCFRNEVLVYENKHGYPEETFQKYDTGLRQYTENEFKEFVKRFDEQQVKTINECVGKNGTIVIMGDVGDIEYVRKLKGYKVLIMGNHDSGYSKYTEVFDEVYEGQLFISDKILLSHEPTDNDYALNIHAHIHTSEHVNDSMHFNVCAEAINFRPISLNWLVKSGHFSKIQSIHRECINRAANRKKLIKIKKQ